MSSLLLPSVFENNSTKMSRRRRMCFVLCLLTEYSCSFCGSPPPATPTPTSFLLSLFLHFKPRSVSSVRLTPRAWRRTVGLIICLHREPGGDHLSLSIPGGGQVTVWWWLCDRQTSTDTTTPPLVTAETLSCAVQPPPTTNYTNYTPLYLQPSLQHCLSHSRQRSMDINGKSCRAGEMGLQAINSWAGVVWLL